MNATTFEKSMKSLAIANDRRREIEEIKREVRGLRAPDGRRLVAEMLRDPSATFGAVRIGRFLRCVRGVGSVAEGKLLRHAGIPSADRKVRDLTVWQREALAFALTSWNVIFPTTRWT